MVTKIIQAKENWTYLMPFETLLGKIGNKSVFNPEELRERYVSDRNVLVIEMLYYGYFGEGNNVNMDWLEQNGYWGSNQYPSLIRLIQRHLRVFWKREILMSAMLLSIKPQYAEMIIEGTKKYEFRTRKCRDDIRKIIFYALLPKVKL